MMVFSEISILRKAEEAVKNRFPEKPGNARKTLREGIISWSETLCTGGVPK